MVINKETHNCSSIENKTTEFSALNGTSIHNSSHISRITLEKGEEYKSQRLQMTIRKYFLPDIAGRLHI